MSLNGKYLMPWFQAVQKKKERPSECHSIYKWNYEINNIKLVVNKKK